MQTSQTHPYFHSRCLHPSWLPRDGHLGTINIWYMNQPSLSPGQTVAETLLKLHLISVFKEKSSKVIMETKSWKTCSEFTESLYFTESHHCLFNTAAQRSFLFKALQRPAKQRRATEQDDILKFQASISQTWLLFSAWLFRLESGKWMWQPVSSITRFMLFPPLPITWECSVWETSIFSVTLLL